MKLVLTTLGGKGGLVWSLPRHLHLSPSWAPAPVSFSRGPLGLSADRKSRLCICFGDEAGVDNFRRKRRTGLVWLRCPPVHLDALGGAVLLSSRDSLRCLWDFRSINTSSGPVSLGRTLIL